MEQNIELTRLLLRESISLLVLLVFLGLSYRLISRVLDIVETYGEDCCEHLERIANHVTERRPND